MMPDDLEFQFGIEAEYLLADATTYRPLVHGELSFAPLNDLLESITVDDLPSVAGLMPQPPHRRVMPYVVEGYHLPDPFAADPTLLPKGIEIRTPVCRTIEETVDVLGELYGRLRRRLAEAGFVPVALAHHPYDDRFEGPQGARSESAWRWAMQAMLTYGPDVNIGLPPERFAKLDIADLFAKVNYYAPAMTLLSLAAPLHQAHLWSYRGRIGKSLRTFRRSTVGQALELHPRQPGRLEFKCFDMSNRADDFRAYLALWTAVLLDESLRGRSDEATRHYELQTAAVEGLQNAALRDRAAELLDRSTVTLERHAVNPRLLAPLSERLRRNRLPADELIERIEHGATIEEVLKDLAEFVDGPAMTLNGSDGRNGAASRLSPAHVYLQAESLP